MGLLPDIDYEKHIPKLLSLFGYDASARKYLTDGILVTIEKVNEAHTRALRTEAVVLALAKKQGLNVDEVLKGGVQ